MITLYGFGPHFGLPDPSPFVMKAEVLLKMAGLAYRIDTGGFRRAPRGKLPYLRDGDALVADSTFIRLHLERRHGVDFDPGLSPAERGTAWAIEKMCEDHLYWLMVQERWMEQDNFAAGPAAFFGKVPAPARPLVIALIRRQIRRNLHGQGCGRYLPAERAQLAERAFAAIAQVLGDKPYLMGESPCGADATVFAFVIGSLCPVFKGSLHDAAAAHPTLRTYSERMFGRYYPDGAL